MNLVDFIADFTHDSSLAHSSIEGFIDYGDEKLSILSKLECSKECLKGRYEGNFDIRNSRNAEGKFEVINMMETEFSIIIGCSKCCWNQSRPIID